MPLNIKNEKAHRMAKELAKLTSSSITDAVTIAIEKALANAKFRTEEAKKRLIQELNEIARHCAGLPTLDERPADEILGYDDQGLPE